MCQCEKSKSHVTEAVNFHYRVGKTCNRSLPHPAEGVCRVKTPRGRTVDGAPTVKVNKHDQNSATKSTRHTVAGFIVCEYLWLYCWYFVVLTTYYIDCIQLNKLNLGLGGVYSKKKTDATFLWISCRNVLRRFVLDSGCRYGCL